MEKNELLVEQLEKWKRLDVTALQDRADRNASEIAVRQEESEKSRLRLIQLSKEFRQSASDNIEGRQLLSQIGREDRNKEVRKQVQPLLKSFQTEVDNLVKRSSCAEAAFLEQYKILNSLPDPPVILDYISQLEEKASENTVLHQRIAKYQQQLADHKSQEEEKGRQQEQEIDERIEEAVKEGVAGGLAQREKDWQTERGMMERRMCDAEEQVGILRRELDRVSANNRASLLNGNVANGAHVEDAKLSLLAEDLDRANERATAAEYKIAELQQQLGSLQRQVNKSQMEDNTGRGQTQQSDSMQRLRDELDRLKSSYQSQLNRMEDQLSRLGSQNALLLSKLDAQRDYDHVKQQLSILKAAQAQYADDAGNGGLDADLLARSRRLEAENAGLRVREMELAGLRRRSSLTCLSSHTNGLLPPFPSSDGGDGPSSSPSPEEPDDDLSDIDLDHLEANVNLTPEMLAKISEAKNVLQTLHHRANSAAGVAATSRMLNTAQLAEQVNRVLEEEGITRCALAKFVLHGSYKMVYDALHDPRPWGFLNSAGRDKYRKLKMWSEDARAINAVKVLQVYCKDKAGGREGMEEPTDLSIPKSMQQPKRNGWPATSFMPYALPNLPSSRRASVFSMVGQQNEDRSPPKRPSPQARRHSKIDSHSTLHREPAKTPPTINGIFRPSMSFTASPVALGISFPDYRKNVLHQITDDMINQFDPLDTDTVTRAVRSKLNKCNVSQRLFGEVVLGMSQGAVSDLLKRPKPWNKLTRPTKEHYVRMQQFLDDEQSIPVLQAIQNREDPERVLAVAEGHDGDDGERDLWKREDSPSSSPSMVSMASSLVAPSALAPPAPLEAALPVAGQRVVSESELSEREAFQAVKEHFAKFYQITDVSRTHNLDTVSVASRIKEELRSRNLQQKLIGELVLDVGQGTVSELLNKPKPFNMLSMKGRENYMKLFKLLQTPEDFTLLEALRTQGQQKANAKRGRSSAEPESADKRSRSEAYGTGKDEDEMNSEEEMMQETEGEPTSYYRPAYSDNDETEAEVQEEDEDNHSETDKDEQIINGVRVPRGLGLGRHTAQDTVIVQPSYNGHSRMYHNEDYSSTDKERDGWSRERRRERQVDEREDPDRKDWA